MAKKKTDNPTGFDNVLDNLYGSPEDTKEVTNIDDLPAEDTTIITEDPEGNSEDEKVDGNPNFNDDSDVPEDILNKKSNKDSDTKTEDHTVEQTDEKEDVEITDEQITEAQQISALFDAVGESLGWNMADINEEDRPLTVNDLTQYLADVVHQNSVPQYADERIQKLDEFVKNGGNFEDFYSVQKQTLSLDNIDLEQESNQKNVISELLRYNGYTEEQINNKIARYEDADMLYEESEDALERLKNIRQIEADERIAQQEKLAKEQYEQQTKFMQSVTENINQLKDIRGITIPKEDRKALYDYIFKVDANGLSQYQKDFDSNLTKNLIESAYFTMKGDTIITGAKKTGETSAAEKLRKLLRHQSKNHSSIGVEDKTKSVADLVTGLY